MSTFQPQTISIKYKTSFYSNKYHKVSETSTDILELGNHFSLHMNHSTSYLVQKDYEIQTGFKSLLKVLELKQTCVSFLCFSYFIHDHIEILCPKTITLSVECTYHS
jgi:hypothetical protein